MYMQENGNDGRSVWCVGVCVLVCVWLEFFFFFKEGKRKRGGTDRQKEGLSGNRLVDTDRKADKGIKKRPRLVERRVNNCKASISIAQKMTHLTNLKS